MTQGLPSISLEEMYESFPAAVKRQIARHRAAAAYSGEIRTKLKALRRRRRLTQKQVAAAMGVNQSVVSRIETEGDAEMGLDTVFRYAAALGLRPVLDFEPAEPVTGRSGNTAVEAEPADAIPAFAKTQE